MASEIKVECQAHLDPEVETLLRQADATLKAILGRSVDSVNVMWTVRQDDTGRFVVDLLLTDVVRRLKVLACLSMDDLRDTDQLRLRLREVWGDLLQSQMEAIGNSLKSILASEGITL